MHNISKNFLMELTKEKINIAFLIELKTQNNENIYFTNHDEDIIFKNNRYISNSLLKKKSIKQTIDINFDSSYISFQIDNLSILYSDIINGKYDYMEITISIINYNNLESAFTIQTGNLGKIEYRDNCFYSTINSIKQKLSCNSNHIYSSNCRNLFCDSRCKLNINNFSTDINITNNENPYMLILDNNIESDYYTNGHLILLESPYKNIRYSIKSHYNNKLYLYNPISITEYLPIKARIFLNCSKTFKACKEKFNNIINFAGEPHVPGNSQII